MLIAYVAVFIQSHSKVQMSQLTYHQGTKIDLFKSNYRKIAYNDLSVKYYSISNFFIFSCTPTYILHRSLHNHFTLFLL